MEFAESEGIRIGFEVEGSGIPMYVPVFSNQQTMRKTLSDRLRQRVQLVYCYHRGTTPSSAVSLEDITMDSLIDDLEIVRDNLGHPEIALFGWTSYCFLAFEYALRYPDRASGLVLAGATPKWKGVVEFSNSSYWQEHASDYRKKLAAKLMDEASGLAGQLSENELSKARMLALNPYFFHDPDHDSAHLFEGFDLDAKFLGRWFGEIAPELDYTDRLPNISAPMLIVHGRDDFWAPYYVWDDLVRKMPAAEFHLLERSGHFPMYEQQDEFDKLVMAWLSRIQ